MRQLWEQSLLRGGKVGEFTLLSPHGSLMLWEQALGRDAVAGFGLEQNAELARRSWNLALEYGVNLERLRKEAEGEDERRFARWTARFEELRASAAWLEPAALPQLLAQDLQTGAIAARGPLYLLGFEGPLPPPQKELLQAVRSTGVCVERSPPRTRGCQASAGSDTKAAVRNCRRRQAGSPKATPASLSSISPNARRRPAALCLTACSRPGRHAGSRRTPR